MVGDVIGRPGRRAMQALLPEMRRALQVDLVVANGENAAGGAGLTWATARELLDAGVDIITSGNHIWHQKEIIPHLDQGLPILRPFNFPPGVPGRGYIVAGDVLVVNLIGRVFMAPYDCPFRAMDRLLEELGNGSMVRLVDFHAEATSEKAALAWYLDGRVSAVFGTHTHVATADPRILPRGTAFVTDVGLTGPRDSVIGDDVQRVLERFLKLTPYRISVANGPVVFNSVLVEVDPATGRAISIKRVDREWQPNH